MEKRWHKNECCHPTKAKTGPHNLIRKGSSNEMCPTPPRATHFRHTGQKGAEQGMTCLQMW